MLGSHGVFQAVGTSWKEPFLFLHDSDLSQEEEVST